MADEKKGVNPLEAGVVGAVIGAAAAAAAIALSDEKNRKKVEKILSELQKNGDKIIKEITKKAMELKEISTARPSFGGKALPKPKAKKKKKK